MKIERRLEGRDAIEVYATKGGQIAIKAVPYFEEEAIVVFDVNDVPTIIKWIQDVAVDAAEIRAMITEEAGRQ
jgi:hypothetical protein